MLPKDCCANSKDLVLKKPRDQLKRTPSELGGLSVGWEHLCIRVFCNFSEAYEKPTAKML